MQLPGMKSRDRALLPSDGSRVSHRRRVDARLGRAAGVPRTAIGAGLPPASAAMQQRPRRYRVPCDWALRVPRSRQRRAAAFALGASASWAEEQTTAADEEREPGPDCCSSTKRGVPRPLFGAPFAAELDDGEESSRRASRTAGLRASRHFARCARVRCWPTFEATGFSRRRAGEPWLVAAPRELALLRREPLSGRCPCAPARTCSTFGGSQATDPRSGRMRTTGACVRSGLRSGLGCSAARAPSHPCRAATASGRPG